jgi:hypothetical protein
MVDQLWGTISYQKTRRKWKRKEAADEGEVPGEEDQNKDDGYDGDMPFPHSILKECTESFLATDEACTKASIQFFDDTGVVDSPTIKPNIEAYAPRNSESGGYVVVCWRHIVNLK